MSQLFASGGQSIGASASASVLPVNVGDLFPLRTDWFDILAVQETLKSLLQHHGMKACWVVQLWRARAAISRWVKRFLQKFRKDRLVCMVVEGDDNGDKTNEEVFKLFIRQNCRT